MTTETYAVFAVTLDGTYRSAPFTWDAAQAICRDAEDSRYAGRRPHVRFYCVRSTDDPDSRWRDAKGVGSGPCYAAFADVKGTRGYGDDVKGYRRGEEKAAREAIRMRWPGWFLLRRT